MTGHVDDRLDNNKSDHTNGSKPGEQPQHNQQRQNVKNVVRIADENGGEDKDKIVKNVAINFANVYGKQASNITDIEKDPLAQKGLNNLQIAAQNYLDDTNPKEANKYKAALLDDKDIKDNFDGTPESQNIDALIGMAQ